MRSVDPSACLSVRDMLEIDNRGFGADSDLHSWLGDGFSHTPVHKVSLNIDFSAFRRASVQSIYFDLP